jgi:hypothetical protein
MPSSVSLSTLPLLLFHWGWKMPCYTGFSRGGIYLSFGDGTALDRLQIAALAIGAAPYHLQMGTLATSARTGTTAEAPGPILTDHLSLALPEG